jgi:Skp family chaperone for outer membrane proteins
MLKFMTKTTLLTTLIVGLILSSSAFAQQTSVAVIDLMKIVEVSSAGKDLQAKFKTRKEAVQKEAAAYEKELVAQDKALQKDRASMSDEEFKKKRNSIEAELKKKRDSVLTRNNNLEKAKNEALRTIQSRVAQITADIADKKKISVVLDRTAVVIAAQSLDITNEVIKELDASLKTVPLK